MKALALRCAAAGIMLATAVCADDRSSGVALSGLTSLPPGVVRPVTTAVELEGDKVVLNLSVTQERHAKLVVRTPTFAFLGEAEPYLDRQFPELEASVNGHRVPLQEIVHASFGTQDITALVKRAGLDPLVVASSPPLFERPATDGAAFDELLATHALEASDGQFIARWSAQRTVQFELGTPPASELSVAFTGRPAFVLLDWKQLSKTVMLAAYCVTMESVQKRLATLGPVPPRVTLRRYEIAVGIDKNLSEAVKVHATAANVVFCAPDGTPTWGGADAANALIARGGWIRLLRIDNPGT